MARLSLSLLGPPLIELDGQPVSLGRHKATALLAYLALDRHPHSRDALATLLWPDLDQSAARAEVRRTLSLLNRALGDGWLDIDRENAGWAPEAEAWLDVAALREQVAACAAHGHPADEVCPECIPLLARAVELYRDSFLAGFTLPDAPGFDEWQFFEGESLRDLAAGALQRLARWHEGCAEYETAIPYARRWLALDPTHEPAHRALMRLYARAGQQAAALRQYAECERLLAEELGVAPDAETTALYQAIRERRELPAPAARNQVSDRNLVSTQRQHNLPTQLTPFVGRERELGELDRLLADPELRLVTVLGPGGSGKTRLALEAGARQVGRYADGVWFASLTAAQSADGIVSAIAQAVGFSFYGEAPPRQQLFTYLGRRQTLLVLDNTEHLVSASVGGAGLLVDLLQAAPRVDVLVTSRVRLNLGSEQLFELGGMAYPERAETSRPDDLRRLSSVVLFQRCARRARPGFELDQETLPHVARICRLVEGMPLAILLAAGWAPALSVAEIAAEVERGLDILAAEWGDEPERHHSMRAVFDATWAMLSEQEQTIFSRLSAFRGGFTREAAQEVAGADLRTLAALVNKSLLQRALTGGAPATAGRYHIHELLRQYGEGKLDAIPGEKEKTLDRHALYYTGFLVSREMDVERGYLQESLREIDNIRIAWQRVTAQRKTIEIARCLDGLRSLYHGPGLFPQGAAVFAEAVDALRAARTAERDQDLDAALGRALVLQGYFLLWFGEIEKGRELNQAGLSLLRTLGARRDTLWYIPWAAAYNVFLTPVECRRLLEETLKIAREWNDYQAMRTAATYLAFQALVHPAVYGEQEAEQHAQEALDVSMRMGWRPFAAYNLAALGHVARRRGEYAKARQCYEKALTLAREVNETWLVGRLSQHLGDVALALEDYEESREYHQVALTCYQDLGSYWGAVEVVVGGCRGIPVSLQRLGDLALAQGDLAETRRQYGLALEAAAGRPEVGLKPHVLLGPVAFLARTGDLERAIEVAALARHHPESVEETRGRADELLRGLQGGLPADVYAAAEARGRARDLEGTIRALQGELAHDTETTDTRMGCIRRMGA